MSRAARGREQRSSGWLRIARPPIRRLAAAAASGSAFRPSGGERGSATAELAAAVPAVLLLLACCLSGVAIAGVQVRLQDAAADAARLLGRGEGDGAAAAVAARAVPGAIVSSSVSGDLVCASLRADASIGPWLSVPLSASSCALGGGR